MRPSPRRGVRLTAVVTRRVVVVGAGIIGLTCAVHLAERGERVEVRTADGLLATTSAVAAAIWYPYRVHPPERAVAWGARTREVLAAHAEQPRRTGVRLVDGVELLRDPAPDPWWREAVPSFARADPERLPPGYADGYAMTLPVVVMPRYLAWLAQRLAAAGGRIVRRRVAALEELTGEATAVVDAAGLGARALAGDTAVTPVRGQVLRVADPGLTRFWIEQHPSGGVTHVIPRSRDVVLGGTADHGATGRRPNPATAEAIRRRAARLEPSLATAPMVGHGVGLRPARPEVRCERSDLGRTPVVHCYGHGGAGVTLSWGCAEEVAALLAEEAGR